MTESCKIHFQGIQMTLIFTVDQKCTFKLLDYEI